MVQHVVRSSRTLFERESELAAVDEALAALTGLRADGAEPPDRPHGTLLAFAGRAGIGKTTLLAEVRRLATAKGCTVLSARGGDQEQRVAFHVARQLLQPQFAGASQAQLRASLGSWYDIVGPALGLCAPTAAAPPDQQGLRDGLDWILTHLAALRAPMVLVLDDAHWADPESLRWLAAFASRAEQLPLLIVVAYRPDELPEHAESFRGLPGRTGTRPLGLEPLSTAAVARLVRETLGTRADDAFCRECWAVTTGNPFETVELLAKVRERGLAPTESAAPLLRDLAAAVKGSGLVSRLERLGASTVRFAWACAVLGTEIHPLLAAAVAGLGHEEAADAADALRTARILTGAETLEFVHPLIATAVYRAIPPGVRVALHGQAAWCVIDDGQGPSAAARHLLETHPDGDHWVVQQLRAAAAQTLRAGAPDAARGYLARALREPPSPADRAAVLYELGSASLLTEPATTVNHLRAALEEPVADPGLRQNIVYRLSQVLAHSDHLAEASDTLAREIRVTDDARVRLRMVAEQFMWDAFRADEPDHPSRSRRLTRLADRLSGRDLTERYVIGLRTWDAVLRGEPAASPSTTPSAPWPAAWAGPNPTAASRCPSSSRSPSCTPTGRAVPKTSSRPASPTTNARAGAAPTSPSRTRSSPTSATGAAGSPRPRTSSGRDCGWPSASDPAPPPTGTPSASSSRSCWPAAGSSRPPGPARTTPSARPTRRPSSSPTPRPCAANCSSPAACTARRPRSSPRRAGASTRAASATPPGAPGSSTSLAAEAHTSPERAVTTALEAVARARQFGAPSAVGQALRTAAEVSSGSARVKYLEEAVTHLERSPAAYELACALVALGTELRRTGRLREAAEHLYRGLDVAVQCGADGLVEEARDELTAAGLRPRRLRSAETDTLTSRERSVANLAAQGRTEAEIAGELHIDEPVVVRLLSAVYRKIGTDSTGLAATLKTQDEEA